MTLKSKNAPFLVGFAIILYLVFAYANGFDWRFATKVEVGQQGVTFVDNPLLSIVFYLAMLVLTYVISSEWKYRLIFMKWRYALPGHRVFTELVEKDSRLSREELAKELGPLPTDPAQQNALWYKTYKEKQNEPVVLHSHGRFLLFRDMFSLCALLFIPSVVVTFLRSGGATGWIVLMVWAGLGILLWASARNAGIRFVCNVLAR